MPNRQLTDDERDRLATPLLAEIRRRLRELSGDDEHLLWALRRKIAKELTYDERGKPMDRKRLKDQKRKAQDDRCAECQCKLPEVDVVLDRLEAEPGYTPENTRLLCRPCDLRIQTTRKFS